MDRLYNNLGLTSVISRLGLAHRADSEAALVQRHLRRCEAAMPVFNLDPATAHLAAEIAAFEDDLPAAERVALISLILASIVALNEGSTRLPVTGPLAVDPMTRILAPFCGGPDTLASDAPVELSRTLGTIAMMLENGVASSVIARAPDEYRPLLYLPPYLYHQRIHVAEGRLAGDLRPRLAGRSNGALDREVDTALADVHARPQSFGALEIVLSDSQREAVRSATTRPLALISGGPGTGKTSIVLAILRVLVRLGFKPAEIALAAPTGKAAHRLGESLREGLAQLRDPAVADRELVAARFEPITMHRLLGYSPRRDIFLHHRNNPLSATVVIVDESSMLDLRLMHWLVAALRPHTRLILLGDADQLPSVAAGAVFRDLVAAVRNPDRDANTICTRLTQSYRVNPDEPAGAAIFNFAQSINAGEMEIQQTSTLIEERSDPAALRFEGVELLSAEGAALDGFLDRWYAGQIRDPAIDALASKLYVHGEKGFDDQATAKLMRVYRHLARSRMLCATRVLAAGADRINEAVHRRAVIAADRSADRSRFVVGEPVMVVRNDYDRDLFNGDQGFIVRVARPDGGETPMAVFLNGDRFEPFQLAALGDGLELCYATTIHKAQGSEFDNVAVILPDRDLPLFTRELLYTAVSRARQSVVLVGEVALLRAGRDARSGCRQSLIRRLIRVVCRPPRSKISASKASGAARGRNWRFAGQDGEPHFACSGAFARKGNFTCRGVLARGGNLTGRGNLASRHALAGARSGELRPVETRRHARPADDQAIGFVMYRPFRSNRLGMRI
jgi:exodeoxyribonuclease V alpha subunit